KRYLNIVCLSPESRAGQGYAVTASVELEQELASRVTMKMLVTDERAPFPNELVVRNVDSNSVEGPRMPLKDALRFTSGVTLKLRSSSLLPSWSLDDAGQGGDSLDLRCQAREISNTTLVNQTVTKEVTPQRRQDETYTAVDGRDAKG